MYEYLVGTYTKFWHLRLKHSTFSVQFANRVPLENRLLLWSRSSGKSLLALKSRLSRESLRFRVTVWKQEV